jgi:bifunctional non-homologous end joining protein LigD
MFEQPVLNPSRARYRRRPRELFVPPLLPTLVDVPPEGDQWEHEIKYDGYRTLVAVDHGKGRAFTRNGHDWTSRYVPVVGEACRLRCRSAAIDGEMVVQDEAGRSDFFAFQSDVSASHTDRLIFYAFDLLELGGQDLRGETLRDRRARLRDLVGRHSPDARIQYSEALAGSWPEILEAACAMELEGIVSKKLTSRYRSGRQRSWLKTKCYDEGEFVVIGAEHEPGKPAFALLARETDEGLAYAGSAFMTLGGEDRDRFWTMVELHGRSKPVIRMEKRKAGRVDPVLRVRVQHLKGGGKLRHASVGKTYEDRRHHRNCRGAGCRRLCVANDLRQG